MTPARVLRSLAAAATLAPSGDNTQPWRFAFDEQAGRIDVLLDETRDPSPMNAGQRMARIALGAAVETLLVEARHRGLAATPASARPPALASVRVSGGEERGAEEPAIRSRVTNRRRYDGRTVPADVLRVLAESTPPLDGVTTTWIADRARVLALAALVGRADAAMFAVPAMLGAFLKKVRLDLAPGADVADGLSTGSLELSGADRMLLPALPRLPQGLLRAMGAFRTMGARSKKLVASSSGLCLVVAPDGEPATDVTVGRALQRAWLALTKAGLAAQPMMSLLVLENALDHHLDLPGLDARTVVGLRDALRGAVPEIAGRRPAALLRFGYAPAPSARVGRLPVEALTGAASSAT